MGALLLRTIPTECIEYGKDKHGGYSTTFWTLMWEGTLQGTENKCRNQTSQKIFGLQSFLPEKNMLWQRWPRTCESRESRSNFIQDPLKEKESITDIGWVTKNQRLDS